MVSVHPLLYKPKKLTWSEVANRLERRFTLLSFDITGDLLFSEPFGMLEHGSDLVKIDRRPGSYVSMMNTLAQRNEVIDGLQNLLGVTSAHVKERMVAAQDDHDDWLSLLLRMRDEHGGLLKFEEIASESLTLFMAAIETVSNTLFAMMYYLATSPLRYKIRALPYLDAVLNEAMCLHSVLEIGLPREVLPGSKGVHLAEFYFPPGTVLSVTIYAIHRSKDIWGQDAHDFRPERWEKLSDRQKTAFMPFGHSPAACVGRNLAEVEMKMIAATLI
ncbi:benzoate 4-monooxygenase [Fusarium tjaetaba]|uniref:Benzoate 4-monooxygenase n=1 Tax=Fusarium tjaetaba TaxID=1567544 RepID=A0A8H5QM45_9HYPO|nr:benzoate 4-monooxygenase [Fusarium tjaetaba]KAF5619165.1 benzoate 4-monooxygenase [Fusarium tjaetaba]